MSTNRRRSSASGRNGAAKPARVWWRIDLRLLVWLLVAVNVLLCLGVLASPRGIRGYLLKRAEMAGLEQKLHRIEEDNQVKFAEIQRFRKDPRLQEKMIRDQLGWAGANETVIEFRSPK